MFESFTGIGSDGLGDMEQLDALLREFDARVPHGEEAFMVLKSHLFAERALIEFINARISDPKFRNEIHTNNNVRNGSGLIALAQGISLRDDVPHAHADVIWPALRKLNRIRNDLAHILDPDSSTLQDKMRDFVKTVSADMLVHDSDVNRAFRKAAAILVAYLHIDKEPLSSSDLE